jgi:hypothetical protein
MDEREDIAVGAQCNDDGILKGVESTSVRSCFSSWTPWRILELFDNGPELCRSSVVETTFCRQSNERCQALKGRSNHVLVVEWMKPDEEGFDYRSCLLGLEQLARSGQPLYLLESKHGQDKEEEIGRLLFPSKSSTNTLADGSRATALDCRSLFQQVPTTIPRTHFA